MPISWLLNLFFTKRNKNSTKKWLIPGLEKGKYKTNSEKPNVQRVRTCAKNDGDVSKDKEAGLKG